MNAMHVGIQTCLNINKPKLKPEKLIRSGRPNFPQHIINLQQIQLLEITFRTLNINSNFKIKLNYFCRNLLLKGKNFH